MRITILDRLLIAILKRLWNLYSTDKKELYRTNIPNGQPLFTADRFILWLVNYENDHKEKKV